MSAAHRSRIAVAAIAATVLCSASGFAQPLGYNDPAGFSGSIFQQIDREPATSQQPYASIPEQPSDSAVPAKFRRQMVAYDGREAPGTIVIDTPNTYLYYVLGQGRAIRYGIGVGREGFTWAGVQSVARKQEWPDWHPPAEMIERQPYLPRFMAGGPGNPLGARAMYLGNSLYRIHGTNAPDTIGKHVSSGCIRLINEDVVDLFNRTSVGAKVVVLPDRGGRSRPDVARNERARERVSVQYEAPRPAAAVPSMAQPNRSPSSLAYGSSASRLY